MAGAAAACYMASRFLAWWLCLPLGLVLLFGAWKRGDREKLRTWAALGLGGMLLWCAVYGFVFLLPAHNLWNETGTYTAVVVDYPGQTSWGSQLDVKLQPEFGVPVRTRLYVDELSEVVKPGDRLEVTARLISPREAFAEVPSYYTARGIYAVSGKVTNLTISPVDKVPLRYLPQVAARRLREKVAELFQGDARGILMALLTGEQEELSDKIGDQLSRTGLRHLVAVSGLHVSFLMGGLLCLPGDRRVRSALAVPLLVLFCALTGGGPSIVRATVMGVVMLLAPFFRRDSDSGVSLGVALFLLLFHNPYSIENVGLQLSFTAVGGILLVTKPLNQWLLRRRPVPRGKVGMALKRWVCASLSVTLGATVLTMPLSIVYFETISLLAPLANLLVLWAVALIFAGGLLAVGVAFFCLPLAQALALPVKGLFLYFFGMVESLSRTPYCAITSHVFCYRLWLGAVYGVILLLVFQKGLRKHALRYGAGLLVLLFFVIRFNWARLVIGGLSAQVLDVGQGQSILFLSEQDAMAVDCGGEDAGNALADAMADVGESQLELLLLTHFDSDHMDGVSQLLERVRVETIAVPASLDGGGSAGEIEALAREYGSQLREITEDATFSFGSAAAELFAPVGQEDDNNSGLSVLVHEGAFSVLVTGDMDSETEEKLIEEHTIAPVDVLIAGHHGSRYSTGEAILQAVQPETVVISAGRYNAYGHPTQETLDRLEEAGCAVYRTDLQGTVTLAATPERD